MTDLIFFKRDLTGNIFFSFHEKSQYLAKGGSSYVLAEILIRKMTS
jgi:hypothetical protein